MELPEEAPESLGGGSDEGKRISRSRLNALKAEEDVCSGSSSTSRSILHCLSDAWLSESTARVRLKMW